LPAPLRFHFATVDRRGKITDQDRDLKALPRRRAGQVTTAVSKAAGDSEHAAVKEWTADNLGAVPETVQNTVDGQKVTAYPTLVATKEGVAVKVVPTEAQAKASLVTATLTMLLRDCPVQAKSMVKGLPLQQRVAV